MNTDKFTLDISLTTIPSRIKKLHEGLESLLDQTIKIKNIYIIIPLKYKRFIDIVTNDDIIEFLSKIKHPNKKIIKIIRPAIDYGPGSKVLGYVENNENVFDDNNFMLFLDDDKIYSKEIAKFYLDKIESNDIVAHYDKYGKHVTIIQGVYGILVRTKILDKLVKFYNFIKNNEDVFFHDDIWLSYYFYFIKGKLRTLSIKYYIKTFGSKFPCIPYDNSHNALAHLTGSNLRPILRDRLVKYFKDKENDIIEHLFSSLSSQET